MGKNKKARKHADPTRIGDVDLTLGEGDEENLEKRLSELQNQLLMIQSTYFHEKRRAIIVFEGWDASGKGGAIRRMTEHLDPRGFVVYPIGAPEAEDHGKHYLYRFWQKLPRVGTMAIFDRSWYGRVLVERVEGLASKSEWKRAYSEINEFEALLVADGVRIVKLFLHISPEEQLERFEERLTNPYKRWKLTADDLRNRARWDDYVEAADAMFEKTSTDISRWHLVSANKKLYARVRCLQVTCDTLARDVDVSLPPIDKSLVKAARKELGIKVRG
jgi:polyphosphate kinase 2 (PPK2 family)